MSRLWHKTCTFTPIGRTSLPHNGWRLTTDHKVRVSRYFHFKPQVPTSRVSVVEVRNVHGERLDRESTITELIGSLRGAPRFAQPEGVTYLSYTCDFNRLFLFQNASACTARICTVQQSGETGSRPLEFCPMWSYQEQLGTFFQRLWKP